MTKYFVTTIIIHIPFKGNDDEQLTEVLNMQSALGWELFSITPLLSDKPSTQTEYKAIFKKV
jgi:hypothetical protein